MANQNNQYINKTKKKPDSNFTLVFGNLKKEWKKDYFVILLNKYAVLIYTLILLIFWQCIFGVFDGFLSKMHKYVISYIPQNPATIWATIFLAAIVIFYYRHRILKIQYRPNLNFSFLVLFIGIFYFSERFSDNWEYYPSWEFQVALVDLYLFFLIGEIISWWKFLSIRHPKDETNCKSFGLDDPRDNDDEFGRNDFAKEICQYMRNSFGNRSLAIGISGSWGTGKSYLLHQIQDTLEECGDKSIVQVTFNPWRSSSHNRIVEDFLQTIKTSLSVYDKSLGHKFEKYLTVLIKTDKTKWVKTLSDVLLVSENKSSEKLYNEINECLKLINKKLVIFIDDLDRLHSEEIIEVFRIVRNTADFYNTCFIVAYDRDYVQNSFDTDNAQMSSYLDKIFQTEFVLPTIDPSILTNIIIDEVLKRFPDNSALEKEIKKLFAKDDSRILILNTLLNRRDAIRFGNMFSFDLKAVQDEVDFGDFFLIILLKMKFPSVYNLLQFRENRQAILKENKVENGMVYTLLEKGFIKLKEKNPNVFKQISHNAAYSVESIINELFNNSYKRTINSIRFVDNYYKYFNLSISSKSLTGKEFNSVIKKPFEYARPLIDQWSKDKNKGSFDIRFLNYSISDFEELNQIKNYVYGMKKATIGINLRKAVTQFHVALNNGGFNHDGFKEHFKNESEQNLDDQIIQILFPEGILDAFNGILIEQLYLEDNEGNNLYSKEKSKSLIFDRFNQMRINNHPFSFLLNTWKTIVSGNNYDDNFNLTNSFVYHIISNKDFKKEIGILFKLEESTEDSKQKQAVRTNTPYEQENDIVGDIMNILTYRFYIFLELETDEKINEWKKRITFFRQLSIFLKIPAIRMVHLLEDMSIDHEIYDEHITNGGKSISLYPVSKEEFQDFDTRLFNRLEDKFKASNN